MARTDAVCAQPVLDENTIHLRQELVVIKIAGVEDVNYSTARVERYAAVEVVVSGHPAPVPKFRRTCWRSAAAARGSVAGATDGNVSCYALLNETAQAR